MFSSFMNAFGLSSAPVPVPELVLPVEDVGVSSPVPLSPDLEDEYVFISDQSKMLTLYQQPVIPSSPSITYSNENTAPSASASPSISPVELTSPVEEFSNIKLEEEEKSVDVNVAASSPIIRSTTKVGYHNDDDAGYAPLNDETIESLVSAIESKCAMLAAQQNQQSACPFVVDRDYPSSSYRTYDDDDDYDGHYDPFDAPVTRMFGRNGNHAGSYSAIHNYNAYIKPQQSANKVTNMKKQRCRKLYNKSQTKAYTRARDAKISS